MDPDAQITLTEDEHTELQRRARSRGARAEVVRRARVILMLAAGESYRAIEVAVGCFPSYITRWKDRFLRDRLPGLDSRHRGQPPRVLTSQFEARILDRTRRPPPDGATQWSTRTLAKRLGVSHMMVARVWARAGLQPHRLRRYMASTDPDFETKAADIIGLYVNSPRHAAVFAMDEKGAIQALDRLQPVLPLSPGRTVRHSFEYVRHGTLSLLAALDTRTGAVVGQTVPRHTSEVFVEFLATVVQTQPRGKEIHVILDNLSIHKTKRVAQFLADHPQVHLHFTPTYSSWLSQIEIWFSKIERALITRGIFTSVGDLRRKIMRYIRHYNRAAQPIRWTHRNPSDRITTRSAVTVH